MWGVDLGRRRVATLPQAMMNMAFGQMTRRGAIFNRAMVMVDHGRWPRMRVWGVILGRRRVATLPQAMINMAFGQMTRRMAIWADWPNDAARGHMGRLAK